MVLIPLFYELAWLGWKPPLSWHTPDHADANATMLHWESPAMTPKGCLSHHNRPGILHLCHHCRRHHKSSEHRFVSTCRDISNLGQPVTQPIGYYSDSKEMSAQPGV